MEPHITMPYKYTDLGISLNKSEVTRYMGIFCLAYWVIDAINIIFFVHKPFFLLWYSNVGLLLTGVALVLQNRILIFTLFCSHFFIELIWGISFFSWMVFQHGIPGVAEYAFQSNFSKKDFIMTLYHLLIPPALLWAVLREEKPYKYGWIGAALFISFLSLLTYFFTDPWQNVNCIHSIDLCRSFLSPLAETFTNPQRILVGILLVTIVVYIPSNITIVLIKSRTARSFIARACQVKRA